MRWFRWARARYYAFTYAWPKIDTWGFGEALCAGRHPLEVVAELRKSDPGLRLISWQEIDRAEFDRLSPLVRGR